MRAYLSKRLREMIFRNARMCSSKAFWNTHILDVSQPCFFSFSFFFLQSFPFVPVSVNSFSREIGQSRGA